MVAAVRANEQEREGVNRRLDHIEQTQMGWLDTALVIAGIVVPTAGGLWVARNQTRKRWMSGKSPGAHA